MNKLFYIISNKHLPLICGEYVHFKLKKIRDNEIHPKCKIFIAPINETSLTLLYSDILANHLIDKYNYKFEYRTYLGKIIIGEK